MKILVLRDRFTLVFSFIGYGIGLQRKAKNIMQKKREKESYLNSGCAQGKKETE